MDNLLKPTMLRNTAILYNTLSQKDYYVTLSNGATFKLCFPKRRYYHLVGLHKFRDIAEVTLNQHRSPESIYSDIMAGVISEYDLQRSQFYDGETVSDRLHAFLRIEDILSTASTAIVPFEKEKVSFDCKIGADLLLFKATVILEHSTVNMHLFFRRDTKKNYYFPVSFFENDTDAYIKNQNAFSIVDFKSQRYIPTKKRVA